MLVERRVERDDDVRRLCRFRIVPWDGGEESGWSQGDDLQRPWFEKRLPDEQRALILKKLW